MALTYSFPNLESVRCSMSGSNCCFLTCIQISQEAGKVVWYSYLSKFSTVHCDSHKGFSVVNAAEVDVFLEFSCFFYDPIDSGNLISVSSAFSRSSLNIWKFSVHILLKPSLENFVSFNKHSIIGWISWFLWKCFTVLALPWEDISHTLLEKEVFHVTWKDWMWVLFLPTCGRWL